MYDNVEAIQAVVTRIIETILKTDGVIQIRTLIQRAQSCIDVEEGHISNKYFYFCQNKQSFFYSKSSVFSDTLYICKPYI